MELENYRNEIDKIDEQLIKTLSERFEITQKVGEYKHLHNLPAVDPNREIKQFARIEELSKIYNLDSDFTKDIMRLIIDEVVKNHKKINS